jgi:hypothetical protein
MGVLLILASVLCGAVLVFGIVVMSRLVRWGYLTKPRGSSSLGTIGLSKERGLYVDVNPAVERLDTADKELEDRVRILEEIILGEESDIDEESDSSPA